MKFRENFLWGGALLFINVKEPGQKALATMKKAVDLSGYTMRLPIDIVSASTGAYDKRYGFIDVNYNNNQEGDFSRSKKKSFDWYKHFIVTNGEEL